MCIYPLQLLFPPTSYLLSVSHLCSSFIVIWACFLSTGEGKCFTLRVGLLVFSLRLCDGCARDTTRNKWIFSVSSNSKYVSLNSYEATDSWDTNPLRMMILYVVLQGIFKCVLLCSAQACGKHDKAVIDCV